MAHLHREVTEIHRGVGKLAVGNEQSARKWVQGGEVPGDNQACVGVRGKCEHCKSLGQAGIGVRPTESGSRSHAGHVPPLGMGSMSGNLCGAYRECGPGD